MAGPGKDCLLEPQRLRYLLAPVLAKSAAEQALFYEVFEKYWADVMPEQVPEPEPVKQRGVWGFLKKWWWMGGILAGVVAVAVVGWFFYTPPLPEIKLGASYLLSETVTAGDTIDIAHNWEDSLQHSIQWEVRDAATDSIEYVDTARNIRWIARATGRDWGSFREIYLTATHKVTGADTTQQVGKYEVRCSNPPDSVQIITKQLNDSTFRFSLRGLKEKNLRQEWDFGDSETASGSTAAHTFQPGTYMVRFILARENADGFCQTIARAQVSVLAQYPTLPFKPLLEDQAQPVAVLGPGFYLLLALLGAGAAWFFLRWLRRKPLETAPETGLDQRLQVNDRAPYDIPFRAQEASIQVDRANYRLAQAMLRRENTERSTVDVPASLRATVDGGGFPQLRSRTLTNPSDYLILLDEQGAESHQAQLFKHLAQLLRGQDVAAEVFLYRTEFHRFWNREHPDGISLDGLQRLYPQHRLVVLGDAHALLDPFADGPAALKRESAAALTPWPRRLLLTPLPPVSWTYRERALNRLFAVFPADLRGQADAALFLENGADEEDLPPVFEHWQRAQAQARRDEPDLNYRRWRTAADHADYLKNSDLYRWLCALAVCPRPLWPLSIAIGRALGAEVAFDNLLLLSRIPWLQKSELDPRLARDLLAQLSPDDERTARAAVARELEAVAELTGDGFAEIERGTQLAIQRFALDPQDPERQATIRMLLATGMVNKRMEGELDAIVGRHREAVGEEPVGVGASGARAFLEQGTPPPPQPPFWTRDLWRAMALAAAVLPLSHAGLILEKTDTLYQAVFGEKPAAAQEQSDLRNRFFVQEEIEVDSAVWYNNRGVEVFREAATVPVKDDPIFGKVSDRDYEFPLRFASPDEPAAAAPFFEKATALRSGNYPLAAANLQKLRYNIGAGLFNQVVSGKSDPDARAERLSEARSFFEKSDSTDALHGAGLCWFFLYKIKASEPRPPRGGSAEDAAKPFLASAQGIYERIVGDTARRRYFDTVGVHPNLEELLSTDPVAYFAVSAEEGCAPFTVSFANLSSHVPSSTYFEWSVSDGSTPLGVLSGFALVHTFEKPGIYDVRLVAKAVDGLSDTFTIKGAVRVIPPPVADFSFKESPKDSTNGTYSFTNLSTGASLWRWDFGDGTQSVEKHPTHRYFSNGPKAVTLTSAVGIGCQDTIVKVITPKGLHWLNIPQKYVLMMDSKKPEERLFKPDGVGLKEYHIAVYSRWGEVIWESQTLIGGRSTEYWDGSLRGNPMPQGTYVWKVLTAVFDDGTEYNGKRTGTVTLLK